ncbi:hypothetical protein BJX61DRAFT_531110 [Aspergillus egyptiacus]|nr:hypothetical protein BJX61DRAFT_531110 [Aspergillus egyptiacus]
MSDGKSSGVVPRWGQLPVEQCLIETERHWDYSSPESGDDQRKRLVREYMQLKEVPKECDQTHFNEYPEQQPVRVPTEEENLTAPVMLRTYYQNGPAGDQKMAAYADTSDNFAQSADWAVLDDAELFNYGSDGNQILSILPEIITCSVGYHRAPAQAKLDSVLPKLKGAFTRAKREHPGWKQDVILLLNANWSARHLLCTVSTGLLWIIDKEAFETDELLVVYLDLKQDITAEGRMDVDQGYMDEILLKWYDRVPPGPIFDGLEFFRLTASDLEEEADSEAKSRTIKPDTDPEGPAVRGTL